MPSSRNDPNPGSLKTIPNIYQNPLQNATGEFYYLVKPVQEKGDERQRKAIGLCRQFDGNRLLRSFDQYLARSSSFWFFYILPGQGYHLYPGIIFSA